MKFPIIANYNFESRDDQRGKDVHAARLAVERNAMTDADLIAALESLESTLEESADKDDMESVRNCRAAELEVAAAFRLLEDPK